MKTINLNNFIKFHKDIKKIYLDIDGVLFHSCQAICDIINKKQHTNFTGDEILSWNFHEICPNITDEEVEELFSNPTFFQYVKWIDGAKEFIEKYYNKIIIITKGEQENIDNKKIFFQQHDINVPFIGLTLDQSKGIIDMSNSLFIDDSTKNLVESNAKYKIMFKEYNDNKKREWQKDWNGLVTYSYK